MAAVIYWSRTSWEVEHLASSMCPHKGLITCRDTIVSIIRRFWNNACEDKCYHNTQRPQKHCWHDAPFQYVFFDKPSAPWQTFGFIWTRWTLMRKRTKMRINYKSQLILSCLCSVRGVAERNGWEALSSLMSSICNPYYLIIISYLWCLKSGRNNHFCMNIFQQLTYMSCIKHEFQFVVFLLYHL